MTLLHRCGQVAPELFQCGFLSVKSAVNSRVHVSANDTTCGNEQHTEQRNLTVKRTQLEIAVIEHEQRAKDSEHHMDAEPVCGRTQKMKYPDSFSQRVKKQQ